MKNILILLATIIAASTVASCASQQFYINSRGDGTYMLQCPQSKSVADCIGDAQKFCSYRYGEHPFVHQWYGNYQMVFRCVGKEGFTPQIDDHYDDGLK